MSLVVIVIAVSPLGWYSEWGHSRTPLHLAFFYFKVRMIMWSRQNGSEFYESQMFVDFVWRSIQAVDVEAVAVTVTELVSYALTLNSNNQSWLITQADIYFGKKKVLIAKTMFVLPSLEVVWPACIPDIKSKIYCMLRLSWIWNGCIYIFLFSQCFSDQSVFCRIEHLPPGWGSVLWLLHQSCSSWCLYRSGTSDRSLSCLPFLDLLYKLKYI